MKLKGIVFDIGNTLVTYPFPLSWSSLYRPAFEHVAKKNNMNFSQEEYDHFVEVMSHQNSRLSPRDTEVTSEQIFSEILEGTSIPLEMKETVKRDFYGFFQSEAHVTPEAEGVLQELVSKGIKTATYSNVAYGMDNELALEADDDQVLGSEAYDLLNEKLRNNPLFEYYTYSGYGHAAFDTAAPEYQQRIYDFFSKQQ